METFEWEDGTVVERPYVIIDGVKHYVQDGTYSGGTPVSSDNLNEMQNILGSNFELKGKIIWTNQNPTSAFLNQTITLDESLDNYDCYEIIYKHSSENYRVASSGKIPVGHGTIMQILGGGVYFYRVTSEVVSGITMQFDKGEMVSAQTGVITDDNSRIVPLYIIGYNTGLF